MGNRRVPINSELEERLEDSDTPHGQQKPENPFPVLSRQHGGMVISVMIGQNTVWEPRRFTVHRNLLDLVSRQFPIATANALGEPYNMRLPSDCPAAFEALYDYMYTGSMRRSAHSSPRNVLEDLPADLFWFELYKFSQRYEIPYLRREAYRQLTQIFGEDEDAPPSEQFIDTLFAPFGQYEKLQEHVVYHTAYWICNQMGDEDWASAIAASPAAYGQAVAVCLAGNNVSHGEWDRSYPLKTYNHIGFDVFRATAAAAEAETDNRSPTIRGDNPRMGPATSVTPQRALSPLVLHPRLPSPLLPLPIPTGSPNHLLAPRVLASSFTFRYSGTLTSPAFEQTTVNRYGARRGSRSPQPRPRTSLLNRYPRRAPPLREATVTPSGVPVRAPEIRHLARPVSLCDDTVLPTRGSLLLSSQRTVQQPSRAPTRSSILNTLSARATHRSRVDRLVARSRSGSPGRLDTQRRSGHPHRRWRDWSVAQTGRGEFMGREWQERWALQNEVDTGVSARVERNLRWDEERGSGEEESVDMFGTSSSGVEEGEEEDDDGGNEVVVGAESLMRAARAETMSEREYFTQGRDEQGAGGR